MDESNVRATLLAKAKIIRDAIGGEQAKSLKPEELKAKSVEFDGVMAEVERHDKLAAMEAKSIPQTVEAKAVDHQADEREQEATFCAAIGLCELPQGKSISDNQRARLEPQCKRWMKARGGVRVPDHLAALLMGAAWPVKGKAIPILSGAVHGVSNLYQQPILPVSSLAAEPLTLLQRVRKVPAVQGGFRVPSLVQTDANEYGTAAVTWIDDNPGGGEGTTKDDTEIVFEQKSVATHEVEAYTEVSETAIRRVPELDDWVVTKLREAMEDAIETSILVGDGIVQPRGIISCLGIRMVNRNTAAEINYEDLVNLKYALRRNHRAAAMFIINDAGLNALELQRGAVTNAPLFTASMANGIYDRLVGVGYDSSHRLPAVGSRGDIICLIPSEYYLAVEQEIVIARSTDFQFKKNLIAFKTFALVGGRMIQERAASILDEGGTPSVTPTSTNTPPPPGSPI